MQFVICVELFEINDIVLGGTRKTRILMCFRLGFILVGGLRFELGTARLEIL